MQPFSNDPNFLASPAVPPQPVALSRQPPGPRGRPMVWLGAGLLVGACVGFVVGSFAGAERVKEDYRNPLRTVPPEAKSAPKAGGSASSAPDPRPPVGARVIGQLPLPGAREALRALTANDKVVVSVGAVGRGDEGAELHLSIQNRSDCVVTGVEGIAYGYDPDGHATAMNAGGEHYVAFASKALKLAPGKTSIEAWPLRHVKLANVALAQIDRVTCEDGRSFGR
ncbi:MAG TPA: hypothetical protein VFS43_37530 [Polyangiaceae bacterium]|nr:hypothetical protein [Polyangiaceae bacterium]